MRRLVCAFVVRMQQNQDSDNAFFSKLTCTCQNVLLISRDTVTHGKVEDLSLSINDELIGNTTTLIRNTFPGMQVFPCLGNNDQWPDDQFRSGNEDIYNLTLARWRHWIDADQEENYLKGTL